MNRSIHLCVCALSILTFTSTSANAAKLASATYDTDSYMFIGTNNEFDMGISTFADYSSGVLDSGNTHFNFAVIKFEDLTGLQTVADGGPSKYLTLETLQAGSASVAISVAGADILSSYPSTSGSFAGPAGSDTDRLQWYFDNIKGDDASYGGYAGGATHVGTVDVNAQGIYSIDVTAIVDAWIDGSVPNYGFGLWAPSSTGGQGAPVDFASMENPLVGNPYNGPLLTSTAVPEPATLALGALALLGLSFSRVRRVTHGATKTLLAVVAIVTVIGANTSAEAVVIPVQEDVMTSNFFTGTNLVRGYDADDRNVHRVSTIDPFAVPGAESIYLIFDESLFSGINIPVASAVLSIESADGGFGANADSSNPFTVSAHAVSDDPLTDITDDTNPTGPTDWLTFFDTKVLPANAESLTVVDSFGTVTFDVTSIVNDWIAGTNTVFALALTGKNDTSGSDFLHGFLNNSENPGSTFLTVTVPEPTTLLLGSVAVVGALTRRRSK